METPRARHFTPSADGIPPLAESLDRSGHRTWQRLPIMEAIFDQMTEGLVIFDSEGNLLDMNPAALAIHGFDDVRRLQRHLSTLTDTFELFDLAGDRLPVEQWPIGRALRGETFDRYDVRVVRADTGKEWVGSYGGAPVLDADGSVLLAVVSLRDVTAEWRAEQELAQAKKQIETALTATEVGVWHWDIQEDRMVGDPNMLRLFGMDENEKGAPLEDYARRIHEADRERVMQSVSSVVQHGGQYAEEYRIVHPERGVRWILARGRVENDAQGRPFSFPGVVVDVTDRRQAEEALRESEALFREMADGLPFIVWVHDADGSQEYVNQTFAEFFGIPSESMTGDKWKEFVHPDDAEMYVGEFARCVREQRPFRATVRARRADGAWRFMESYGKPRLSESGEFRGFVGASVDITEHLEAENAVRELNRTLERRVAERTADLEDRNRELQQFAYVASHDLREPLRKIRTFGDLLLTDMEDALPEQAVFYVDRMRSAAQRMDTLLNDLLAFSRLATHAAPHSRVDLNTLIHSVLEDYELMIGEVQAKVDVIASGIIEADAWQLKQLISNLLDNALKFRRDGVTPRIRIVAEVVEDYVDAPQCRITVEDNGIGFDVKYAERIFSPFERLHGRSQFEGTGMGLAMCRRIVQRHRGEIIAEGRPGDGSRFVVTLPVAAEAGPGSTPA